jgi:tRNA 2-selenouridine synthase
MYQEIDIHSFLRFAGEVAVVDVRTPAEFKQGHIPSAHNIPIFSNSERKSIGTIYKNNGRQKAVLEGLEYAGPKLTSYIKKALKLSRNNKLLLHCWRGGMRSASIAWLLQTYGISCQVLNGGYKSFRTMVLSYLSESFPFIVVGGLTGSGKTDVLQSLALKGEQILDLEGLSNHKGSAFGHLGEPVQNTNEQFENDIFWSLNSLEQKRTIWVEDESRNIGRNTIPGKIYSGIRNAPVIFLDVPLKDRIHRLVNDYASFPADELIHSIEKISTRLGGKSTQDAIAAVQKEDYEKTVELVLRYYDKTYGFGLGKRESTQIFRLEIEGSPAANEIAEQIMDFSEQNGLTCKLSN